jgi:hypothetical protein
MMKRSFVLFIAIAILVSGCAGLPKPKQLYTACNIWIYPRMHCINFKGSYNFIPAGTEITLVRGLSCRHGICFKAAPTGDRIYHMQFNPRWHPGKTIKDYRDFFFTTKNFAELTQGLTEREIKAITKGLLVEGMSKKAVLISYGLPPEHRTPMLSSKVWIYWINRARQKKICFDQNDNTIRCNQMVIEDLKPL